MPAPTVTEEPEPEPEQEGADDAEAPESADTPEPEAEPDVAEVDLSDGDLRDGSADDLFTGQDDATTDDAESDGGDDGDGDDSPGLDELGERGEGLEEAINDGAARLSVVGIEDDDTADDLEEEFAEVFQSFRLGYFGSRFAEEYVFVSDDDEVDPAWGLFGASLTCLALVIWMRPDGEEMVGKAREAVENIT